MTLNEFLLGALVYLAAAVISAPLAKRLGLGSVLGFLVAGAIIGPSVLGIIGTEGESVKHFAEFGVIVMLFLVGLELEPSKLWALRKQIFGLGLLQVTGVAAAIALAALPFTRFWQESLTIGLILAMSSTAIVLQSLQERGILRSPIGQSVFSVLLFQDISVIPILALLPLLATTGFAGGADHSSNMISEFGPIGAGRDHRRHCDGVDGGRPVSHAASLSHRGRHRCPRNLCSIRTLARRLHHFADDADRALTSAWHIPRRCGARRQRIPSRT